MSAKHGTWRRLKRFELQGMVEYESGDFVRLEDAKKIIEEIEDKLQELEWEAMWEAMGEDL